MTSEQISNLTDNELVEKLKSSKNSRIINAFLLGFSFAVMLVGLYFKGLGVGFFIPLAVFILFINSANKANNLYKNLLAEIENRNLTSQ